MKYRLFLLFFIIVSFFSSSRTFAQQPAKTPAEQSVEAVITQIKEEKQIRLENKSQLYQKIELRITSGSRRGTLITAENGNVPLVTVIKYQPGDKVVVTIDKNPQGKDTFYITDFIRREPLYILFGLFAILTAVIGKKRGISSFLGMIVSFFIIFLFVLPHILSGGDPIVTTIIASIFIIPITFYLSHGFNSKTSTAIAGTVISLLITGLLAGIFVSMTKLTGLASEDASFLQAAQQTPINFRGILLAGIIISTLGVLNDITISQAAIVVELREASSNLTFWELYKKSMNVGKDHIASMVNTLILVYTGSALPLLLLFVNNPHPFGQVISYEIVTQEIVKTLVASCGIILAVPITTLIACFFASYQFKIKS